MSDICSDKSLLISYLYDECDAAEREAIERHLASCAGCASELRSLRGVRHAMSEWSPPEAVLGFRIVSDRAAATPAAPRQRRFWQVLPAMPVWAQLAAAVLVLAVGAAIANVDVSVGNGVVTITAGRQPAAKQVAASRPADVASRAELAALEQRLRAEMSQSSTAAAPTPVSNATPVDFTRRMQPLIDQSEQRQQKAFESLLATRLVQFARDIESQRRADLVRIEQGLGQVEGRTTSEIAQMRQVQRYMMRVANIQEIK